MLNVIIIFRENLAVTRISWFQFLGPHQITGGNLGKYLEIALTRICSHATSCTSRGSDNAKISINKGMLHRFEYVLKRMSESLKLPTMLFHVNMIKLSIQPKKTLNSIWFGTDDPQKSTVDLHFLGELAAQTDFVGYFQFLTSVKRSDAKLDKIGYNISLWRKKMSNVINPVHCEELVSRKQ